MGQRARSFVGGRLQSGDTNAIVITHGFVLTFLTMAWLNVPVEHQDFCGFRSTPGSVTLLNEDDFLRNRTVGLHRETTDIAAASAMRCDYARSIARLRRFSGIFSMAYRRAVRGMTSFLLMT